jgi:hypothetical protein
MVAIIGGEPQAASARWWTSTGRPAAGRATPPGAWLRVGVHAIGFLGRTTREAADDFYPGFAQTFTKIGKASAVGEPRPARSSTRRAGPPART